MRLLCCVLATGIGLYAAVDGTVINGTTGQPQASVVVSLMQPGQSGMQNLGSTKSDAQGKFKIEKDIPPGPALVQALYQGATYNVILTPGTPTTGVKVEIFDSTSKPESGKVAQDMLVVEPSASALQISQTLMADNTTKMTFQDPAKGSVQFYVPPSVTEKPSVTVSAPGGMPIQRPLEKTGQANIYKVNYPLKPGETRFDIAYTLPPAEKFAGKSMHPGAPTRIVTPSTVTLSGEGIESLGQEPQTKAHIYSFSAPAYEFKIEGQGSLRVPESQTAAAPSDEDNGSPKIEEAPARVYTKLPWVLGLGLGILFLGGALLFRRGAA